MELSKITSRLAKYHPKQVSMNNSNIDIVFFQLSEKEKSFSQEALYICNVSSLPKLPLEHGLCFLCIKDVEVPKEYLKPENELNIITVDNTINTYDAIGILSRIFSDDSRVNNARSRIINALHSGKGLQNIVNEAFLLLQNPVIVSDIGYKIIAMCTDFKSDSGNDETEKNNFGGSTSSDVNSQNFGYLIESGAAAAKREKIHNKIREDRYPYYSVDDNTGIGRIHSLVYIHGIEIAEVSVMGTRRPIDDVDLEAVDFLCKIISLELQKNDLYMNNPGIMHSFLLSDLLNGQIKSKEVATERMKNLNWNLNKNLVVMIVADQDRDIFEGKAQIICTQLHNILTASRWVIYEGRIVILLSFKEQPEIENNQKLVDYLEKNNLISSISSSFTDILKIQKFYNQAKKTFDLGLKLKHDKPIYCFDEFIFYHMGEIISKTEELSDFYHPGVVAVYEYDTKHKSSFMDTLELFLQYSDKTEEIAKHLFIHKNTVLYRINKLKEQFGLELNNGEERLKMLLTIKLMKLSY